MLDVYAAREQPVGELAGVSGLDVARAAADHAGGRPVWWLRDARDGAARARRRGCGPGDLLVTIGAGDIFTRSARRWWRSRHDRRVDDAATAASSATTRSPG